MTKSKKLLFVLCSMLTFFFVQFHPALAKKVRYNYFCTHGIIAQPESYEGLQLTKLAGEGKEFRWYVDIDNYNRRFFIPLTSPVMTESTHVFPAQVYLLFKTIYYRSRCQLLAYLVTNYAGNGSNVRKYNTIGQQRRHGAQNPCLGNIQAGLEKHLRFTLTD